MDKNILISEMLYIIFVHYKGLGKHYKVGVLKNEMNRSLTSVKLLYKEELSDSDIEHLKKLLCICRQYISTDIADMTLDNITGGAIEIKEPADKMCEIIGKVISESSRFFVRDKIALYLHALHNLPRAYLSGTVSYTGLGTNLRITRDEALKYCNEWLYKI